MRSTLTSLHEHLTVLVVPWVVLLSLTLNMHMYFTVPRTERRRAPTPSCTLTHWSQCGTPLSLAFDSVGLSAFSQLLPLRLTAVSHGRYVVS